MKDLQGIFRALRPLLQAYAPPLSVRVDDAKRFEVWSEKEVVIEGRKRKEVFFAALIIQKSYVGFYFMPAYTDEDVKAVFDPELLALLKGKSCFHIKNLEERLMQHVQAALQAGFELYTRRGWV